jgi:hypothetical protein
VGVWLLRIFTFGVVLLSLIAGAGSEGAKSATANGAPAIYLGFDRNNYPGDAALATLRKTFSYTSYWLNTPPGATTNTWAGKREKLEAAGFGFLVVFNGRLYAELKSGVPAAIGKQDATLAAAAARREGFRRGTVIFLDQEQGGRLLPEQKAYLYAWVDAVAAAGFLAGVYCSGMPVKEADGTVIVTADDVRSNSGGRQIMYWVFADPCPPSPGCVFSRVPPKPSESGVRFADVWQYAQSPRRRQYTAACRTTYHTDGNCYPPGLVGQTHVDVNTAASDDPSRARTH